VHEGSRKAIFAAFLANLGIALAKFAGFLITGATAMLAEAVHSVADTTNQGLLFLGGSKAKQRPTPDHPFGYGRERYFWAFVVAVIIFTAGSMFALYEGEEKLRHPHELESPAVAVAILLVALALESFSLRTAVRESRPAKGDLTWWGFIRRAKVPELPVVLLEDLGALLGLSVALVGVGLAAATGNGRFDALGSIAIGLLLGVIAVILAVEMKSLLIGESAEPATVAAIRAAMESDPRVRRVIHLRTEHLGPDDLLVGAKVEFDHDLALPEVAEAIDAVEERVRVEVPEARIMYVEPDVYHPEKAAAADGQAPGTSESAGSAEPAESAPA
jgi:cation diffusion facilitator family transporter